MQSIIGKSSTHVLVWIWTVSLLVWYFHDAYSDTRNYLRFRCYYSYYSYSSSRPPVPLTKQCVVAFFTLLARHAILLMWKCSSPPKSYWVREAMLLYSMYVGSCTASLNLINFYMFHMSHLCLRILFVLLDALCALLCWLFAYDFFFFECISVYYLWYVWFHMVSFHCSFFFHFLLL